MKNNLDIPLASISFTYEVRSPGRAIPWREGEGNFFIDGGLEPGEERTLRASPKSPMPSFILAFNALKDQPDAKLTISVANATDANRKLILPPALSSSEEAELARLRQRLTAQ